MASHRPARPALRRPEREAAAAPSAGRSAGAHSQPVRGSGPAARAAGPQAGPSQFTGGQQRLDVEQPHPRVAAEFEGGNVALGDLAPQRRVGAAGLCGGGGDVGAVVQHEPEGSGEVFSGWGVGHRGYARNTFQHKGNCGLCPLLSPRAAVPAPGGRTLLCC